MSLEDASQNKSLKLVLGLGLTSNPSPKMSSSSVTSNNSRGEPCLSLGLPGESCRSQLRKKIDVIKGNEESAGQSGTVSSFSSSIPGSFKRERDISSEEGEAERISSRASDEDEEGSNTRKKLRLTKEQSAMLEENFKQHSTLNPKQKQALARELNLRPRQVEVWFQNRRARTKLKQTEVDCELLKKCCETLSDENRRLQKELQELKALKQTQPLYVPMPAATLTMCPSCESIGGGGEGVSKSPFSVAPKPHCYRPFNNPSAAC